MQTQDYIVDNLGNFRFTSEGLDNQATLLAKAGINARDIKTYAEYIHARKAARPFFLEYLREETDKQLNGKPATLEWQAIRSIAYGSQEEQKNMLEKLKRKKTFRVL